LCGYNKHILTRSNRKNNAKINTGNQRKHS
jgi:hypothetical protein